MRTGGYLTELGLELVGDTRCGFFDNRRRRFDGRLQGHATHAARADDGRRGRREEDVAHWFLFLGRRLLAGQGGDESRTGRQDGRYDAVPVVWVVARLADGEDERASLLALICQDAPVAAGPQPQERHV